MRLENPSKEETRIRELEEQIGKARSEGKPVDVLIDERRQTYESWLGRLDREIPRADEQTKINLINQRERAVKQYS